MTTGRLSPSPAGAGSVVGGELAVDAALLLTSWANSHAIRNPGTRLGSSVSQPLTLRTVVTREKNTQTGRKGNKLVGSRNRRTTAANHSAETEAPPVSQSAHLPLRALSTAPICHSIRQKPQTPKKRERPQRKNTRCGPVYVDIAADRIRDGASTQTQHRRPRRTHKTRARVERKPYSLPPRRGRPRPNQGRAQGQFGRPERQRQFTVSHALTRSAQGFPPLFCRRTFPMMVLPRRFRGGALHGDGWMDGWCWGGRGQDVVSPGLCDWATARDVCTTSASFFVLCGKPLCTRWGE